MKQTLRWLVTFCLTLICVVASSWNPAYSQTVSSQPIFPKYVVMGVVYAPPGSASSVTYGNTQFVGSSDSFSTTASNETIDTTSFTAGATLGLFGASITYNNTNQWTTSSQHGTSVSLQSTDGNAISTMGPISSALGINHDNDIIYIWLNPVASMAVTGVSSLKWTNLASNSCDPTDSADILTLYQQISGCDANQYPYADIVGIPVWCLKNPYYPGQGCAQWLPYTSRSWDLSPWGTDSSGNPLGPQLTLKDYADILQADPFVSLNGNSVNVCHPSYNPDLDPNDVEIIASAPITLTGSQVNPARTPQNCGAGGTLTRFLPYGTVEYPEPGPNGLPSTYTGNFQYSQTNTAGTTATDTHTTGTSVDVTASFGFSFGLFGGDAALSISNATWVTLQNQSAFTGTTGTTQYASYSITGPQLSDNYTGPATYNVYLDNVYGTYAFYSALETKPAIGNIGISATSTCTGALSNFGQITVGMASSSPQEVCLTNNSTYPLTVVWPAVTFSDPGFQLVSNNGSFPDGCSNQVLPANGGQCKLWIEFAPVASDVAYTPYGSNQAVTATMIAAGTENAFSYENILVTNNASVSGTAVPVTTQVATLFPTPIQNTTVPCPPPSGQYCQSQNMFNFTTADGPNLYIAQKQVFTFTNYYSSSVTINGFTLTDANNFSVVVNNCTTVPAPPSSSNSCTITVQFLPVTTVPSSGVYTTKITATGTVSGSSAVVPLAIAGAAGTVGQLLSITPTSFSFTLSSPTIGSTYDIGSIKITNLSSYTVNSLQLKAATGQCCGAVGQFEGQLSGYPCLGACTCPASTMTLAAGQSCLAAALFYVEGSGTQSGQVLATGILQTTGSPNVSSNISNGTITVSGAHNSPVITLSGSERSATTVTPATKAKASITVSGSVKSAFTGQHHVSLTVGTFNATAFYGDKATSATVARALAAAANTTGSPVTATVNGDIVTLTNKTAGAAGNIAYAATNNKDFAIGPRTGSLMGGADAVTKTVYDSGSVGAAVGSVTASATWGKESTPQKIAVRLAAALNTAANGAFTASATGGTITITSKTPSSTSPLTVQVNDSMGFSPASYSATTGN